MKVVRINIIAHHRRRQTPIHFFKHIPLKRNQPRHPGQSNGLRRFALELPHHLVRLYNLQSLVLQSLRHPGTEKLQLADHQHNAGNTARQILDHAVRDVQLFQKAHYLLVSAPARISQNHGKIQVPVQQSQQIPNLCLPPHPTTLESHIKTPSLQKNKTPSNSSQSEKIASLER